MTTSNHTRISTTLTDVIKFFRNRSMVEQAMNCRCSWILRRRDILAVHLDYFSLTGRLERWLYRIARKAVPEKAAAPAITFRMKTLHQQSGTTRALKLFAYDIRKIAETQPLPEYGLRLGRDGKQSLFTLYRDLSKPGRTKRGFRPVVIESVL